MYFLNSDAQMKESMVKKQMKFVLHGTFGVLKKIRSEKLDYMSHRRLCNIVT